MLDYEVLRFIWWLLIVVLMVGFAITDGFDMGVTALLPVLGKNNTERRIMINAVAPHWDGNQVWLITLGGAIFAAWPTVYATMFSGFYIALILVLATLFFRPVGFEYRSKIESDKWRNACDTGLFLSGFVPALVFGVAVGNLMQGVPFYFNEINQVRYTGGFFELLNPFALLAGVISLLMFVMQGAAWLQMKTTEELRNRSRVVASLCAKLVVLLFVLAGVWVYFKQGYVVEGQLARDGLSVLKNKTVAMEYGAWFNNYLEYPVLFVFPVLVVVAGVLVVVSSNKDQSALAFVGSSLMQVGVIATAFVSMFPFVMPSVTHPEMSLTVWDATASELTLKIMFYVACIFVPIVLAYTLWSYLKMFGRLDAKLIQEKTNTLY